MKSRQELEKENNGLNVLIQAIEEEFNKGVEDENGDVIINETSAARIKMLLEQ